MKLEIASIMFSKNHDLSFFKISTNIFQKWKWKNASSKSIQFEKYTRHSFENFAKDIAKNSFSTTQQNLEKNRKKIMSPQKSNKASLKINFDTISIKGGDSNG